MMQPTGRNCHYQLVAVREIGKIKRDARLWNGAYLDIFIYTNEDILNINNSFLRLLSAIVLQKCDRTENLLLAKVEALYASTQQHSQPRKLNCDI
ncbi:hypothetical protein [Calothrix sp. UHCC 0171]|uniref:hypothetical protein n=1 Tax=Calothrix sp. UHCC 0171 TaxID=3110245 RepID=UPI002B20A027|nr:hypothetical protein [Calothrix sp. UHCC 0171]MEA5571486.1 hypothetical protein [Calothrix sp. UHCC 0171]